MLKLEPADVGGEECGQRAGRQYGGARHPVVGGEARCVPVLAMSLIDIWYVIDFEQQCLPYCPSSWIVVFLCR